MHPGANTDNSTPSAADRVRSLDLAEDFIRRMINDHKENR